MLPQKDATRENVPEKEASQEESVSRQTVMPQHCAPRRNPPIKKIFWHQLSFVKRFWGKIEEPRQHFLGKERRQQKPCLLDQSVKVLVQYERNELVPLLLWCLRGEPNLPFLLGVTEHPRCLVIKEYEDGDTGLWTVRMLNERKHHLSFMMVNQGARIIQ